MTTTLITGANGFIGYHLAKQLCEKGSPVRCLVRRSSDTQRLQSLPVEIVYGEIRDRSSLLNALNGVGSVYHLAGLTRETRPGLFQEVNVGGTRNLAEECLKLNPAPTVVFVSSLAAAGPAKNGRPKTEADPARPMSAYGKSKLDAERIWIEYSETIPCSVVRPPIVFGETDEMSLELFRVVQRTHFHFLPGWINRPFSFIHASDLAELLIRIPERGEHLTPESEKTGQGIYFANCGENVRFAEFGRMIGHSLELRHTFVFRCPPLAVLAFGLYCEVIKRISGGSVSLDWNKAKESLCGPWICDGGKAQKQLGFVPGKSLQERLNQTTLWYKENGFL